jgi:hypothetical protein
MTAPIADTRQAGGPSAADLARYGSYGDPAAKQGWVLFAGTMIAIAGCMNIVHGIAAIDNSKIFRGHAEIVVSNLNTWGWIVLCLGAAQILAAIGIWSGNTLARWFGVAVAFLNALGQLTFANAYPIWSLTIFGLDLLVIYGLVVHGRDALPREDAA